MAKDMNGLVLEGFHEKTLEELEKDYQKILDDYQKQTYGVELNGKEIEFIATQVLENAKWKGTEVYGINAVRKIVVALHADKIVLCERENIRALFHFLNQYESVGTEFIDVQMDVLEKVSLVIKEINEVENDLRDASFEIHAKRQGIDPEQLRKDQDAKSQAPQVSVEADAPSI